MIQSYNYKIKEEIQILVLKNPVNNQNLLNNKKKYKFYKMNYYI